MASYKYCGKCPKCSAEVKDLVETPEEMHRDDLPPTIVEPCPACGGMVTTFLEGGEA